MATPVGDKISYIGGKTKERSEVSRAEWRKEWFRVTRRRGDTLVSVTCDTDRRAKRKRAKAARKANR
jgi:hypothetical protein